MRGYWIVIVKMIMTAAYVIVYIFVCFFGIYFIVYHVFGNYYSNLCDIYTFYILYRFSVFK